MPAESILANTLAMALGTAPAALLCIVALLGFFYLLARICDEAIAPLLEKVSKWLKVPPDVACATFLALGSSAPEIFISCVSTAAHVKDTEGAQSVSMGVIFGSAVIAFTIVPAACVFASPGPFMKLKLVPLLRDALSYVAGLLTFVFFVQDGRMGWRECLVLVCLFFVYLLVMRILMRFYATPSQAPQGPIEDEDQGEVELLARGTVDEDEGLEGSHERNGAEDVHVEQKKSCRKSCKCNVLPPFGASEATMERHWKLILFISILYVSLIGEACLEATTAIAALLRIPDHILGVLLVAFGAQIPDAFASIAVAEDGEGPGAVANAIGSQVMNLLIGLGLPFLISTTVREESVIVDFSSATSSGIALLCAVMALLLLATRRRVFGRRKVGTLAGEDEPSSIGLSRTDAMILLFLYALFAIFEIATSLSRGN